MQAETLITEHLDLWTSAVKPKKAAGRGRGKGSSSKRELYGLKKLRELILELAVRGQLVPQDPNDEPASVLLERIAAEKAHLIAEKKIKKQKALPPITDDEKPFDLPQGWEFVRFGNTLFNRDAERIPLSVSDRKNRQGEYDYYGASGVIDSIDDYLFDKPLLLIGEDGANLINRSTPIAFIARGKYWVNNHAHVLDGVSEGVLEYVGLHINAISLEPYVTGTAQPKMNQAKMNSIVLAIPPLAEQHRIVAKVDELMQLCDQLEQTTETNLDAHQTLVENLLAALVRPSPQPTPLPLQRGATPRKAGEGLKDTASCSPSPVQRERGLGVEGNAWQRIVTHFDTLFTTEHSIDQLKQTILQLAVMGKLVPQDPNDESASVLLEKIAAEKAQLIAEKKIKKQKALPPIGEDEKPFALPDGWEFYRFADIVQEVATGPFGSMINKREYISEGVPLINPSHMINGKIVEDTDISVSQDKAQELYSYSIFTDDIVMARRGEMGRCAVVTEREHGWLCGTGSFVLRFHQDISRRFVLLLFKSAGVVSYLGGQSVGTTMTNLNHGILNKMPIALPPLVEQQRIVAKVDELMALCDQLKARLNTAQQTQWQLADAVAQVNGKQE